eukprot:Tamp_13587.p2 GENE.Tamp_13587~~Tamp_13587.p2  ORF type:complete len:135 (+),score=20.84 Tamp_13587:1133-1537(+)
MSSLHRPDGSYEPATHFRTYAVPVLRLADLLAALPWGPADQAGRLEVVEQLKIDAQGADVEVLKGAGPWLRDKVVCVTAEAFVFGYEPGYHTAQELVDYMISQGFRLWDQRGGNYLFINSALQAWLPLVDCYTQ